MEEQLENTCGYHQKEVSKTTSVSEQKLTQTDVWTFYRISKISNNIV